MRTPKAPGPSIAKTRGPRLVHEGQRVRASESRWRELFAGADAISEGQARDEAGGAVWYGTTSLILRLPESEDRPARTFVAALAERDVHVRLRAVRVARREAQSRAPGRLGVSRCEIRVSEVGGGVRIDVDIQAPLIALDRDAGGRGAR